MTWEPVSPEEHATIREVIAPVMLTARFDVYGPLLRGLIDDMSSDPRTLDLLSHLICFTQPSCCVEVGTYRGIGAANIAETFRFFGMENAHLWTCDPEHYDVEDLFNRAGISDLVTYVQGTFEHLLAQLPRPMNFCYIDASDLREASMRLRYTKMALERGAPGCVICVDDAAGDWRGAKTLRRMCDLYLPQQRGLAVLVK